jgi:ubiquinol oxidase
VFYNFYFFLYLLAPRTAHRVVAYFEEEAVFSYTQYLAEVDAGRHENIPAPQIAIDYWQLPEGSRLRDVIIAVRADEAEHRDVNHYFVAAMDGRKAPSA